MFLLKTLRKMKVESLSDLLGVFVFRLKKVDLGIHTVLLVLPP